MSIVRQPERHERQSDAEHQLLPHPKTEINGVYGAVMKTYARRKWGQLADSGYVYFHNRPVMRAVIGLEQKVGTWKTLDRRLATFATMASAGVIGCSWCLDFSYFLAHDESLNLDTVREVPCWRESDKFSPLERQVLEYAEAMTTTPLTVTDEMVASLTEALSAPAMVKLTQLIALESMRSRFNSAVGLASQGYSDVCELPLAVASPS